MPTGEPTKAEETIAGAPARRGASRHFLFLALIAPLDWLILAMLICAEIVSRVVRAIAPRRPPRLASPRPECSFIILSWNSQSTLECSLPPLMEAIRKQGGNHEIVVVDNHSTDGTDEFVRRRFPEVRLVSCEQNVYFGAGNRLGVDAAKRDIVVLMNSDTIVDRDFLAPLLSAFNDETVFGVASVVEAAGQCAETANTHACFDGRQLKWSHEPVSSLEPGSYQPVFWLHRGLVAIDRRKYLWLDGFDNLYDPIYMEDVDSSYRAWKVGWKCLLAVDSRVTHRHHLGTPLAGETFARMLVRRNQSLFVWKNIADLGMLARYMWHSSWLRVRRARMNVPAGEEVRAFLGALERLPLVLAKKIKFSRSVVRSDREVFDLARSEDGGFQTKHVDSRSTGSSTGMGRH